MHDIKVIRTDPSAFDAQMARRNLSPIATEILDLDNYRRSMLTKIQEYKASINGTSSQIGALKAQISQIQKMLDAVSDLPQHEWSFVDVSRNPALLGSKISQLQLKINEYMNSNTNRALLGRFEEQEKSTAQNQHKILSALPNILDGDVPDGPDESANIVLHQHGAQPNFPFDPRQHFELGESLGMMDFAAASKLAGARFTVLRGPLARLERALGQWMVTLHADEHGFTETSVPLLVNDAAMYGTGQLPKFKDDLFQTTDGRWLVPTAEVPLTNLVAGEILAESALPRRFTALTPSFRSEAGSAGRDTRGMLRQHQFSKVELVSVTRPEDSAAEHERMTACAERVLTELGLSWRRVLLCAGDTGFAAAKTFDLEVWLPGQGAWREISSCSNCRDFQARRMGARYRPRESGAGKPQPAFVHTLNGSGVAVGRALIAVMETHQQADGSVLVPEVLRPWMGGLERIAA